MHTFPMLEIIRRIVEGGRAKLALVGPLSRVDVHMLLQVFRMGEFLRALLARIRPVDKIEQFLYKFYQKNPL